MLQNVDKTHFGAYNIIINIDVVNLVYVGGIENYNTKCINLKSTEQD